MGGCGAYATVGVAASVSDTMTSATAFMRGPPLGLSSHSASAPTRSAVRQPPAIGRQLAPTARLPNQRTHVDDRPRFAKPSIDDGDADPKVDALAPPHRHLGQSFPEHPVAERQGKITARLDDYWRLILDVTLDDE